MYKVTISIGYNETELVYPSADQVQKLLFILHDGYVPEQKNDIDVNIKIQKGGEDEWA